MSARETLHDGDWTLCVCPAVGGAVTALRYRAQPVLRESAPHAAAALDTACFALVPYANRIAHGRFHHGGRDRQLPRNFGDHPHTIHGVGWQVPWRIVERECAAIELEQRHHGGASWPWPYVARQRIAIAPDGVVFTLGVESLAEEATPIGLGFHPAFPVTAGTVLQAGVGDVWLADAECLPTVRAPAGRFGDFRAGAPVQRADLLDNCYEHWNGAAVLTTGDRATLVRASAALRWLHIYIPPGRGYCCVEPVSHMPDAVNRSSEPIAGRALLEPGQSIVVWMRIDVAPSAMGAR
jgi:aldose 1-epimerase